MKLLALETSSPLASICILVDGEILFEAQSSKPRFHSQWVHGALSEALNASKLSLSEIDCFALGKGPGRFTGLRVAGSVMKTFGFLFQKPLVAVDSLSLLLYPLRKNLQNNNKGNDSSSENGKGIIAMIQAHRNQIYWSFSSKEEEGENFNTIEDRKIHLNFPP